MGLVFVACFLGGLLAWIFVGVASFVIERMSKNDDRQESIREWEV